MPLIGYRSSLPVSAFLIWMAIWCELALAGYAHDPGLSTAIIQTDDGGLMIQHAFAPSDVLQLLLEADGAPAASEKDNSEALASRLRSAAPELWEVRAAGRVIHGRLLSVAPVTGDNIEFNILFPATAPHAEFMAKFLDGFPAGHRVFVTLKSATGNTEWLLSRESPSFQSDVSQPKTPPRFAAFVRLGIEHIWTGYDHLLFLLGLLIVCQRARSVVTIISCFTLAHSITLTCATLGWVNASPRYIEPLIAASIAFIGAENLWLKGREPRGRAFLTFAFGLIHGFGFASVLKDLGVGTAGSSIAVPLFSFNLGVELGQLAITAVVLPIVWRLRRNAYFARRTVPLVSAAVLVLGLYWLCERLIPV